MTSIDWTQAYQLFKISFDWSFAWELFKSYLAGEAAYTTCAILKGYASHDDSFLYLKPIGVCSAAEYAYMRSSEWWDRVQEDDKRLEANFSKTAA